MNLNTLINALWLFGVWWISRDPHGCIKTIQFQIGNIDNEGRFLYKIYRAGPWCAVAICLLGQKQTEHTFIVTYKSLTLTFHFIGWRNWKFQSVMKTLKLWTKEFCYLTWLKWLVTFPTNPQQKAGHCRWQWKVWLFLDWKTRKPLQLLSIVSRQSHNIEVVQGAIFMEQNIRVGLILGRLAILKKQCG